MKFKFCVVTSTRAEYGCLRNMLTEIKSDNELELCLFVTGTHLSNEFGMTVNEIENDGFHIDEKIEIVLSSDTEASVCKSMGLAAIGFGEAFQRCKPDVLIVVGDRYELLPICSSALIFQIPIAHISGGEITEGAIDDNVRHAVTKLSYWHFAACETYRQRIIQMGEMPSRVFNYGDIGVDNLYKTKLLDKEFLEKDLSIDLNKPTCIVTFHPVTLEANSADIQINELLKACDEYNDMNFIFTKANADTNGRIINNYIDDFVLGRDNVKAFYSLGSIRYLSMLKYATFVMGNSSSGIIEAPAFGIPTINIGDRQKGRLQANSIINCPPIKEEIIKAINFAISDDFREVAKHTLNPYGNDDMSKKTIWQIKHDLMLGIKLQKGFYDISFKD